mmetsp:Transcript_16608/g.43107  ORF Transcript_16608/g.43107 Transcript_16608/m.43107 type:complete len:201 (+) Transcript_16608:518-1120(+)
MVGSWLARQHRWCSTSDGGTRSWRNGRGGRDSGGAHCKVADRTPPHPCNRRSDSAAVGGHDVTVDQGDGCADPLLERSSEGPRPHMGVISGCTLPTLVLNHSVGALDPNYIFDVLRTPTGELDVVFTYACLGRSPSVVGPYLCLFNILSRRNQLDQDAIKQVALKASAKTHGRVQIGGLRYNNFTAYQQCGMASHGKRGA